MAWIAFALLSCEFLTTGWVEQLDRIGREAFYDGQYKVAEESWAVVVAYYRNRPDCVDEYTKSLNSLGSAQYATGKLAAAEEHFREACRLHRGKWGDGRTQTPAAVSNLIRILLRVAKYDEAEELLAESLKNTTRLATSTEADLVELVLQFAQVYCGAERWEDAARCGRYVLSFYSKQRVVDFPVAMGAAALARVYVPLGKKDELEQLLAIAGRHDSIRPTLVLEFADYHLVFGKPQDALGVIDEKFAEFKRLAVVPTKEYSNRLNLRRGEALARIKDDVVGKALLRDAISGLELELGATDALVLRGLDTYAKLYPMEAANYVARATKAREQLKTHAPKGFQRSVGYEPGAEPNGRKGAEGRTDK